MYSGNWQPNAPPLYPQPVPNISTIPQLGMQQLQLPTNKDGGVSFVMPNTGPVHETQPQLQPQSQAQFQPTVPSVNINLDRPKTADNGNMVLVQQAPVPLGREPQRVMCPHCNAMVQTYLDHHSTYRTHLFAFLLCITGLICLAPLPYCMKTCKSLDHYCSNCNQFIGVSPL